jgi:SAM-dependent methyltransferase
MSSADPTDYDAIADHYAAGIDARAWNALYERPATLALLPDVRGRDVLDAGCGHGWYAEQLVGRGARVTAFDRSARMVEHARRRLGDRARVFHAPSDRIAALADAGFDLVLSALVVHYVADLDALFGEWARLLRPGGRAVLSTHHPMMHAERLVDPGYRVTEMMAERWGWLDATMRYYRRPISAITEALAGAGFVIERLVEPMPLPDMRKSEPSDYARLERMPAFVHIRARKDTIR